MAWPMAPRPRKVMGATGEDIVGVIYWRRERNSADKMCDVFQRPNSMSNASIVSHAGRPRPGLAGTDKEYARWREDNSLLPSLSLLPSWRFARQQLHRGRELEIEMFEVERTRVCLQIRCVCFWCHLHHLKVLANQSNDERENKGPAGSLSGVAH